MTTHFACFPDLAASYVINQNTHLFTKYWSIYRIMDVSGRYALQTDL